MNALAPISYEQNLKARYAMSRSRLWTGKPPVVRPVIISSPAPEPAPEPKPQPKKPAAPRGESVPLDMLKPCSWRFLLKLTALRHRIPPQYILSPVRQRKITRARHEAIGLVYQHTQMSMPKVGVMFGRDHTTVLNSLRQVNATKKLVEMRPDIAAEARPKETIKPASPSKPGLFRNGKGWTSELAA